MPTKPPHPCAYPGCPRLTNERYCDAHKTIAGREYNKTQRRPDYNKTYGRRWHTVRDLYIAKHPLCERCLDSERLVPADLVHHIVPTAEGGGNEDENLMSLCNSCHASIHSGPAPGGGS